MALSETPVNVPLNLHVKSPCNQEYIDRGVNDENSINDNLMEKILEKLMTTKLNVKRQMILSLKLASIYITRERK